MVDDDNKGAVIQEIDEKVDALFNVEAIKQILDQNDDPEMTGLLTNSSAITIRERGYVIPPSPIFSSTSFTISFDLPGRGRGV